MKLPRYSRRPNFKSPYAKLSGQPNRKYGERAYTDPFRPEASPGMLRREEPDYELDIKPYRPQKPAEQSEHEFEIQSEPQPELKSVEDQQKEYMEKISAEANEPAEHQPVESDKVTIYDPEYIMPLLEKDDDSNPENNGLEQHEVESNEMVHVQPNYLESSGTLPLETQSIEDYHDSELARIESELMSDIWLQKEQKLESDDVQPVEIESSEEGKVVY